MVGAVAGSTQHVHQLGVCVHIVTNTHLGNQLVTLVDQSDANGVGELWLLVIACMKRCFMREVNRRRDATSNVKYLCPRYGGNMAITATPDPAEDATDRTLWLTPEEKDAWSGLVSLVLLLPGRLEAPLQHAAGLTLFEYLTLSHMSEAPERRLRMSELAYLTNGSLSRLSNVVKRFEQRGWVQRFPDPADGRYTIAALTDTGYGVVVAAAPIHVRSVRQYVLDTLSPADQRALSRIAGKLRTGQIDLPER
ncbi:MarR family winged helix-turn-helix transcriptional regulator [Micromonospora chokoriensis]